MSILSHSSIKFNHLSLSERKIIQNLFLKGSSISYIASLLGRNKSTISRQINNKRNLDFIRVNSKVIRSYSASKAHCNYSKNKARCGAKYKLFKDPSLIKYLEHCVSSLKWSPQVAIGRAKGLGWNFKISISAKSVYNYIDRNQINISPFDLRFKLRRKKSNKKHIKQHKRKLGTSIENRPEYINNRSEFGHMEGDCIVDKDDNAIFVAQERISKVCFMFKLKKKTSENVNISLKTLLRKNKWIKSFTFDNGSEFYRVTELENENLKMYFTHPYCSYEKGGVENLNGIIRRYIPKGKNIKTVSRQQIQSICQQINNTPRKILNYATPYEYLQKCMLVN